MSKKEQLKIELDMITKSIHTFLQSFEFCYYLQYPKKEEKLDEIQLKYITKSGFFSFTGYALWRVTILELHKLLNDNKETEKYNLNHIIRKLKKGGIYQSLEVKESKIDEWTSELIRVNQSVVEVGKLRFKLYAHTDNDYRKVIENSELTFEDTEELINVIIKIVFEIYLIVFDTYYEFKPLYEKRLVGKIIEDILSKRELDRKKRVEEVINKSNEKNCD